MNQNPPPSWSRALGSDADAEALWVALGEVDRAKYPMPGEADTEAAWHRMQAALASGTSSGSEARIVQLATRGRRLSPKRKSRVYAWLSAAAAAVLLLFFVNVLSGSGEPTAIVNNGVRDLPAVLPDATRVILAPGSELTFVETEGHRVVEMSGEIGFDVSPDPSQPFRVDAEQLTIVVVGTEFTVRDGASGRVSVSEGHVRLRGFREADWVDLRAGDFAELEDGLVVRATGNGAIDNLKFRDVPLREVLSRLGAYHGVSLTAEARLLDCTVTASFGNESLEDALNILKVIFSADVESSDDGAYLRGGKCS